MKLYFKYVAVLLKSQMQYRTSFILQTVGQFFVPFLIFVSLVLFFQRFTNIMGWTLYEVALVYAVTHLAFSLSECFVRGFDSFSSIIRKGDFDRILVRPRTTVLQVLGSKFEFSRLGRLTQGFIVFIFAVIHIDVNWNIYKVITLFLMVFCGIFIFAGIFIIGATLCFWTVEGLEVVNLFTDGGREMCQYPLNIYADWLKNFFTFVIPFGTINYLPLMYLLDKETSILYMLIPLIGTFFLIPALIIWKIGVRHYTSTGS